MSRIGILNTEERGFYYAMQHRHLDGVGYSLPKIDDIIERGGKSDWVLLQRAVRNDVSLARDVFGIASHNINHPYTIRYGFWLVYSEKYGGAESAN